MAMGTEKHARGSADDRSREPLGRNRCTSMPDDALDLLLQAVSDDRCRRQVIGRLPRRRRPGLLLIRNHTHRGAERH